jgi:hypothetical protein
MDIFDEVIKDVKDEKHYNAFKKAFPIIIAVTVLLVILMSVKSWLDNKHHKHNTEIGDLLNNAVVLALSGQGQAAKESFDYILKEADNHSKDLAALGNAIQLLQSNDNNSLKSLEEIAENKYYQELSKSYAKILWLSKVIDFPIEEIDQNKMQSYLNSFKEESKVFYGTANLIKALWLVKQDKDTEAEQVLKQIIDSKFVNHTNKNNAQAILANLKAKKYSK